MMINKNEITKEMLEKAMQCKSADELIALGSPVVFLLPKTKPRHTWRSWPMLSWTVKN